MSPDNGFRTGLEEGDVQFGALATTCTPLIVEVYGDVGFDFVFVDLEHGGPSPYDSERLGNLVRAGETAGTDLLVRLPSGRPPLIRKVLDAGVRNVIVPRVRTADEVRTAAAATRFTYDGNPGDRGVGSARSTRWGGRIDADYPDRADDTVSFGVMVENRTAIENVEEIVSVPGVNFTLLGHYDLAVSLGHSEPTNESVQENVEVFERACRDAGVPYGRYTGTAEDAVDRAVDSGYRILLAGDETSAVRDHYADLLSDH